MNKLYTKIITVALFATTLFIPRQAYACVGGILSPEPSYKNEWNVMTGTGNTTGATSIFWRYGLQSYERNFHVNISGWSCVNGTCTGDAYTGSYSMSIEVNTDASWLGRLGTDVDGSCPMGYQTVIDRPTSAYKMDTTVQSASTGLLQSLVAVVIHTIPIAIVIVGGLVVTLFGLRWLIRRVRSFIGR